MLWWPSLVRRALKIALALLPGAAWGQTAFVTCQPADALSVIDLAERAEVARWSVPGRPAGVAVGNDVYTVSTEGKTLRRLDFGGAILAKKTFDGGPIGVVLGAGRVFVSDWFNARIFVLNADDLSDVAELPTGTAPAGLALSPDGRFLASADKDANQVSLFDPDRLEPLGTIPVGTRPFGLAFAPDGRLFVGNVGSNDVTVLDPDTRQVLATVPVGERPYGVAFAQGRAFVTNQYENTLSVIDLATLTHETKIEVGEYPEGIDAMDGTIVLANWFDNTVTFVDAQTLAVIDTVDTCDGPRAFGRFLGGKKP